MRSITLGLGTEFPKPWEPRHKSSRSGLWRRRRPFRMISLINFVSHIPPIRLAGEPRALNKPKKDRMIN